MLSLFHIAKLWQTQALKLPDTLVMNVRKILDQEALPASPRSIRRTGERTLEAVHKNTARGHLRLDKANSLHFGISSVILNRTVQPVVPGEQAASNT